MDKIHKFPQSAQAQGASGGHVEGQKGGVYGLGELYAHRRTTRRQGRGQGHGAPRGRDRDGVDVAAQGTGLLPTLGEARAVGGAEVTLCPYNAEDQDAALPGVALILDQEARCPFFEAANRPQRLRTEHEALVWGFARLLLRVAQTFLSGATDCDHAMLREPWWPELLDATKRLEAQVTALGDDEASAA